MKKEQNLQNAETQALNIPDVVCSVCFTKNSIRSNKVSISVGDKQGSFAYIFFDFCEECGHRYAVDWWD